MKTILTSLLLIFTFSTTMFAQQAGDDVDMKDPKAKAILDQLSKKNKSYSTIVAKFDYRLQNKDAGIDETQKGDIKIKGDKYFLNMAGQQIISDGKKIYTWIPEIEELQIKWAEEDDEEGLISPSDIFTLYESGFNYKYAGTQTMDGVEVEVIKLFPEKADKPYHTAILYVKKAAMEVKAFETRGKDGNTYTFKLTEFAANRPLNDQVFTFDKSKALDIIDFTE